MKRNNTINRKGLLKNRLKFKVQWTFDKLRFCLSKSNTSLYWQLINDEEWKTIFWLRVKNEINESKKCEKKFEQNSNDKKSHLIETEIYIIE